jgi:hypothetical protein
MVSFTSRPLYPQRKNPWYPLDTYIVEMQGFTFTLRHNKKWSSYTTILINLSVQAQPIGGTRCRFVVSFTLSSGKEPSYKHRVVGLAGLRAWPDVAFKSKVVAVFNEVPRHEHVWGSRGRDPPDGGEWSASRPDRFTSPRKGSWYPLYRRPGRPQSRSGHGGEKKSLPGIEPPSSSL